MVPLLLHHNNSSSIFLSSAILLCDYYLLLSNIFYIFIEVLTVVIHSSRFSKHLYDDILELFSSKSLIFISLRNFSDVYLILSFGTHYCFFISPVFLCCCLCINESATFLILDEMDYVEDKPYLSILS